MPKLFLPSGALIASQPRPAVEKRHVDWHGLLIGIAFLLVTTALLFCVSYALVVDDMSDRATSLAGAAIVAPVVVALGRSLTGAGKKDGK